MSAGKGALSRRMIHASNPQKNMYTARCLRGAASVPRRILTNRAFVKPGLKNYVLLAALAKSYSFALSFVMFPVSAMRAV